MRVFYRRYQQQEEAAIARIFRSPLDVLTTLDISQIEHDLRSSDSRTESIW